MTQNLPGVFFVHFEGSSFVADTPTAAWPASSAASSPRPTRRAYVHMAGVAPELRRQGIGRKLYEAFIEAARAHGRSVVRLITAPINTGSIAFHEALGFELERVLKDFAGPDEDRLVFIKQLG